MPVYLCWRPDWCDESGASGVTAAGPREAAERWAEDSDRNDCEYPPERDVCVKGPDVVGTRVYVVSQYPVPVYEARVKRPPKPKEDT